MRLMMVIVILLCGPAGAEERLFSAKDFEAIFPELQEYCDSQARRWSAGNSNSYDEIREAGMDQVVDVFVEGAFEEALRREPHRSAVAFFRKCAKNEMIRVSRSIRAHVNASGEFDSQWENLSDGRVPRPWESLDTEYFQQVVVQLIEDLVPSQRDDLWQWIGGRSVEEIAHHRGRNFEAIKRSLHRARERLSWQLLRSSVGPECEGMIARWRRK